MRLVTFSSGLFVLFVQEIQSQLCCFGYITRGNTLIKES